MTLNVPALIGIVLAIACMALCALLRASRRRTTHYYAAQGERVRREQSATLDLDRARLLEDHEREIIDSAHRNESP